MIKGTITIKGLVENNSLARYVWVPGAGQGLPLLQDVWGGCFFFFNYYSHRGLQEENGLFLGPALHCGMGAAASVCGMLVIRRYWGGTAVQ